MKSKALKYFAIGIVLIIQGILVYIIFQPAYPCSASGIGCSSAWEMLRDDLPSIWLIASLIAGMVSCFRGIGEWLG